MEPDQNHASAVHGGAARLTPLDEPAAYGWRPQWPFRVWLLPFATFLAAMIVAAATAKWKGWTLTVSPTRGVLVLITVGFVVVLTYAQSESRWPLRAVFAVVAGAIALGVSGLAVIVSEFVFAR